MKDGRGQGGFRQENPFHPELVGNEVDLLRKAVVMNHVLLHFPVF